MTSEDWKNIATIGGIVVGVLTLLKGLREYRSQGRIKEAEFLLKLINEHDDPGLQAKEDAIRRRDTTKFSAFDLRMVPAFYETVGLLWAAGILRTQVAYSAFGVQTIESVEWDYVWEGDNRSDEYWYALNRFYKAMKAERARIKSLPLDSTE